MLLPIQDALLLTLVVGAMCVLIAGDLSAYLAALVRLGKAGDRRKGVEHSLPPRSPDIAARRPSRPMPLPRMLPRVADLLVVDDSAVARAKLRKLFVGANYTVQLASDGVEAMALLAQGQYSMMITDLEMPNMDGIALIHGCLRQPQTAGMPIIAVSGHENLRAKFNECRDICGVHRKPWVDDILLSHVAALIGTPNPASARASLLARSAA
jgi:CheY-like chemotaxis protein